MSRATIKVGPYTVCAGWDRPCNNYFGSIEGPDKNDDPIYSTIDDPGADMCGGFATLEEVKNAIEIIVGKLPQEFWDTAGIKDMNQVRVYNA